MALVQLMEQYHKGNQMKKYTVLNPMTGLYQDAETIDECLNLVSQTAYNLLLNHTHEQPYSIVEINDDGSETWRNPAGEEILSPAQIKANIKGLGIIPQTTL